MQLSIIFILCFSLIVALFAVQNAVVVPIDFLQWHFETSLVFVILLSAFSGALAIGLLSIVKGVKQGLQLKNLQSKNNKLTGEVTELTETKQDLTAEITDLKAQLAEAQKLYATQIVDPEDAERVGKQLAATNVVVLDDPLSLVSLALDHLDDIRHKLGDCSGFYQLSASEEEISLIVNSAFWETVEADYPAAIVDSGWRLLSLQHQQFQEDKGYLQAIIKVLEGTGISFRVCRLNSYALLVKEEDLLSAVRNIQILIDSYCN